MPIGQKELVLLKTLAQHAAIAIDNALLYEDLRRSQLLMPKLPTDSVTGDHGGRTAHEIRNPLTSIKTFVQLAQTGGMMWNRRSSLVQVVCEDVERIERLVHEILDYARYMTPKLTQESLNDAVSSCLYFIEGRRAAKPSLFKKNSRRTRPTSSWIVSRLNRCCSIYLSMRWKPSEANRAACLSVHTRKLVKSVNEPWVQIEVEDSGPH